MKQLNESRLKSSMKIYYSVYDALRNLSKYRFGDKPNQSTGWGKFIEYTFRYLQDYGYTIVDSIEEADLELFLGQPPLKIFPSMSPNVIFTMYEASKLPQSWVDSLNNWDVIINPSNWGCKCFRDSGVSTKIIKIPLWVDPYFEYKERDISSISGLNSQWTYLSMGVQLTDRKNQMLVMNLFKDGKLPNDTKLLVKTTPVDGNNLDWHFVDSENNVHLIQKDMEIEGLRDLVYSAHVSVNPSSGEGFGNLVGEHMLAGCCTILSDFSAVTQLCNIKYNLPLRCKEIQSPYSKLFGTIGEPDKEHLLELMLWTYENREEALYIGEAASEWIKHKFSIERFCYKLNIALSSLAGSTPKKIFESGESKDNYMIETFQLAPEEIEHRMEKAK